MNLVRYTYPAYRSPANALGRFARSPWNGLENEIERLFASTLADFGTVAPAGRFPVDLYEDKANTYVRAELPGVNKADITVEVVDGYLSINATRKALSGGEEQSFALNRSVSLPDEVQADKVAAAYENGVLTVTLPKQEEAKPRKITVAVN
ncbi:MAG: Hsp20/alpha crystallin family protein [Opitutaceae bacterium]|jgi:HSP20 family protein|nr:Hsp20/alpha crystallin family protein [Opitutaceae bacterium]MBP9912048.1 Hsp20/alpha crystallin family protein [Opitutaceae bacterium]